MKLGISCIAWEPTDDQLAYSIVQNSGLSFVEVVPGRIDLKDQANMPTSAAKVKKDISDCGLSCSAMQALLSGASDLQLFGNDSSRANLLEHLIKVFAAGEILGVEKYVFGSPKNRIKGEIERTEALSIATEFFRAAAKEANKYKGCLCIEANPAQYGADFILNSKEAFDLVEKVDHDGFGLHLDSGGMILGKEDIASTIKDYVSFIKHFHVSAPNLCPIYSSPEIDIIRVATHTLRELRYAGTVSLEMKGLGPNVENEKRIAHISSGIDTLKSLFLT